MDTKAVFLRCRFGASSPQAIGVTRKLPIMPIIRLWCILGDKPFQIDEVTRMRVLFP